MSAAEKKPASPLVIAVCSPQCAQAFFIPGPGDLNARPFYAPTLEQPEPTEGA